MFNQNQKMLRVLKVLHTGKLSYIVYHKPSVVALLYSTSVLLTRVDRFNVRVIIACSQASSCIRRINYFAHWFLNFWGGLNPFHLYGNRRILLNNNNNNCSSNNNNNGTR